MIECPECHAVSHNHIDELTGWCAACYRFTGKTAAEVRAAARTIQGEGDPGVASTILYRLRSFGAAA